MKINSAIITYHLSKCYRLNATNPTRKASLCSFRFYHPDDTRTNILYIMRVGDFAYFEQLSEENAYLVIGAKRKEVPQRFQGKSAYDILYLEDDVDVAILANHLNDIFDQYYLWEEKLDSCSKSVQGVQDMIDYSDCILQGDIILADFRFNYVAYSSSWANEINRIRNAFHGQTPDYIVEDLLTNPEYIQVQNQKTVFEYPIHRYNSLVNAYCQNLFRPNEEEYCSRILFVPYEYPATEIQLYLLEFFAHKLNRLYNQISDYSMPFISYHELRSAIRNGIKKEPISATLLSSALKFVDWNLNDTYQLLTFTPYFFDNTKEINAVTQSQIELMLSHSCTILHENKIVVVINLTKREKTLKEKSSEIDGNEIANFIRDHLYKVGSSAKFSNFSYLHQAYLESIIALQQGNRRDSTFWFYDFTTYSLQYMIEHCQSEINSRDLCIPGLVLLENYDEKHGTMYVQTLCQYIESKYNVTHTAEKLFVHRTTLVKHLKRIQEISHMDLEDWNTRLHLVLSIQMLYR